MDSGRVGSHSTPTPADRMISAIPGRSEATTGTPAAIASHSFWGVVNSWLVEVGWIGITITSADAVQARRSSGATAGRTNTRFANGGSETRARRCVSQLPNPSSTSTAPGTSRIARIDCSMPRCEMSWPW